MSCGVGHRHRRLGSSVAVAVAQAGSCSSKSTPSLGPPYTEGTSLKSKKTKTKNKTSGRKYTKHQQYINTEVVPKFCVLGFFLFVCFFRAHLQHMEVPRLGVKSEIQLPAYTTATATQNLNHVCHLYHSLRQHQILNPLSRARDQTCILMDTSWIHYHWVTLGTL